LQTGGCGNAGLAHASFAAEEQDAHDSIVDRIQNPEFRRQNLEARTQNEGGTKARNSFNPRPWASIKEL
jgi:hypothetical protein